ncbi:MAG: hypothetical protein COC15_03680 [Legionellales bacterium]|nr:MAG: hypothetical protein COC15_03680 [Legionellales bacterium]
MHGSQLALTQQNAKTKALEAEVKLATWQLKSVQQLAKNNNVSEEFLLQRSAQLAIKHATLATHIASIQRAERVVRNCNIVAPFTGVISSKIANIGELANIGTPLLTLIDNQQLEVAAQLYSQQIAQLQDHSAITFVASNNIYKLVLRAIVPALDSTIRSQSARFSFVKQKALPGTAGRLIWHSDIPQLPATYIQQQQQDRGFFIVENNKAKFIAIPNALEGQPAAINSNTNVDLIVQGRYAVQHNSSVTLHKS